MRPLRTRCALVGVFLLTGIAGLAGPSTACSRDSGFQGGVAKTIHEIVDLMASGSQNQVGKSDMKHLRNALNELLNVLEGQGQGHQGKGQMGKGLTIGKNKSHAKDGSNRGNDAAKSGTSGRALTCANKIGGNASTKATAKNATPAVKNQSARGNAAKLPGNNVGGRNSVAVKASNPNAGRAKTGAGPQLQNPVAKNGGAKPAANRKPATNQQNAGAAKTGVPRSNLAKNTPAKALANKGKSPTALNANNAVGARPGSQKTHAACNVKNAVGTQATRPGNANRLQQPIAGAAKNNANRSASTAIAKTGGLQSSTARAGGSQQVSRCKPGAAPAASAVRAKNAPANSAVGKLSAPKLANAIPQRSANPATQLARPPLMQPNKAIAPTQFTNAGAGRTSAPSMAMARPMAGRTVGTTASRTVAQPRKK